MSLQYVQFKDLNLQDAFFDSLKGDYKDFSDWFIKKAEDKAYVVFEDDGSLQGFLYLKCEEGTVDDVTPSLPFAKRIKIGTFKINAHGTKLGERFVKIIFDYAISNKVDEIYVTIFEKKYGLLVELFKNYGFLNKGSKSTLNGTEVVMGRKLYESPYESIMASYPKIPLDSNNIFLLAIYPKWHTRLFPDSILEGENDSLLKDVSHTNSIHKVYLGSMPGMDRLKANDVLLIYRTTDKENQARYRSVVTSICVMEEYKHIASFPNQESFINYCEPFSVFTREELMQFWSEQKYKYLIKFTYNIALKKRLNRDFLINNIGLDEKARWGFMPITNEQLLKIASEGGVDKGLFSTTVS